METDAEGQIKRGKYQQSPESLQQQRHQADLEHVGVEHHQENNDHVEQDGNVLDAADRFERFTFLVLVFSYIEHGDKNKCVRHQLEFLKE